MLIPMLLRLIATIFTTRPPFIKTGQWSSHARDAVRMLETRHFRFKLQLPLGRRVTPSHRTWVPVSPSSSTCAEGEWTCKP